MRFPIEVICVNNCSQIAAGRLTPGTYYDRFNRWPTAAPASLDRTARRSNQILQDYVETHKGKIVTDAEIHLGYARISGAKPILTVSKHPAA
jgi:hypothetical protein